jgi:hypothetical protein
MPPKLEGAALNEWISTGFKYLVVCIVSMGLFVFNNFSKSVDGLTVQLRAMEQHQVDTDRRVAAIEVSREVNMSSYSKLVQDVQEMKASLMQVTMRLQSISEFVAKHFK